MFSLGVESEFGLGLELVLGLWFMVRVRVWFSVRVRVGLKLGLGLILWSGLRFNARFRVKLYKGIADGIGNPGCKAPVISMVSLTFLRSCNSLHLPDFFFITKIGEFQGELEGIICPLSSYSCTNCSAAVIFSAVRGH